MISNTQGIGPNFTTDEESFFQSDRDLELSKQRKQKEEAFKQLGNPLKVSSKILDFAIVKPEFAYVAQAGYVVEKINLANGEVLKTFTGHKGPVTSVAVQYVDGKDKYILTGSWDKTIKKWDTDTAKVIYTCEFHSDFVKSVLVYGDKFYSASTDGIIACWDLESGKLLGTLNGHKRAVEYMIISPDGQHLYSCSSDTTIRKWCTSTLSELNVYNGHLTSVYRLTPDWEGEALWSVSADKTAVRWDLNTGKMDSKLVHPDFVKSVAILNNGQVITGCRDENIRIWDPATEKTIAKITAHYGEISTLQVDGPHFWSGSLDCTLRKWDYREVLQKHSHEEKAEPIIENLMTEEEERELAELMSL